MDMRLASTMPGGPARLVNFGWNNDRYPDAPELNAHTRRTVLDMEGPGMITQIHSTHFTSRSSMDFKSPAGAGVRLRVWYDGESAPAIDMPLMDFLGDCECGFDFYATKFFSKVRHSHNCYLLMPFERRVRVELDNPSDEDLFGYLTIQTEALDSLPPEAGYLRCDYRSGERIVPDETIPLFEARGRGRIAAHWLRLTGDNPLCAKGECLCEGNDLIYLDGGAEPALEYLGTEDYYGFSWGFHGTQSDGYCAITQEEPTPRGGAVIGMLRCREGDAISYARECRIEMDYRHEYFSALSQNPRHARVYPKASFPVGYVSCYYYYQRIHCGG